MFLPSVVILRSSILNPAVGWQTVSAARARLGREGPETGSLYRPTHSISTDGQIVFVGVGVA